MNVPVDLDKIPPSIEDFPGYVHEAIEIFNTLPDTYSGGMEPVFSGKDLSALQVLFDVYRVEKEDYRYILDVLRYLIYHTRKKALADAKKNRPKSK